MVVKTAALNPLLRTLAMTACLVAAPMIALGQAEPDPAKKPKLSDAWLSSLPNSPAVAWSHAFALRHDTAVTADRRRRRLIAELDTLIMSAQLGNSERQVAGLTAWRQHLVEDTSLPARTPGRHDLPWLGAHLRQDTPLARIVLWGSCEPPAWVEIWHLSGVTRLPWQNGLQLDDALARLSLSLETKTSYESADNAWLITPTGEQHRRGIASWNAQATPLAAGSRVMLELPSPPGLSSALPFSASRAASKLINERLPGYLATRLPGDDCTTWSKDT